MQNKRSILRRLTLVIATTFILPGISLSQPTPYKNNQNFNSDQGLDATEKKLSGMITPGENTRLAKPSINPRLKSTLRNLGVYAREVANRSSDEVATSPLAPHQAANTAPKPQDKTSKKNDRTPEPSTSNEVDSIEVFWVIQDEQQASAPYRIHSFRFFTEGKSDYSARDYCIEFLKDFFKDELKHPVEKVCRSSVRNFQSPWFDGKRQEIAANVAAVEDGKYFETSTLLHKEGLDFEDLAEYYEHSPVILGELLDSIAVISTSNWFFKEWFNKRLHSL